jgi:hypothetical protein
LVCLRNCSRMIVTTMWIIYLDTSVKWIEWIEFNLVGITSASSIMIIGFSMQNVDITIWRAIVKADSFELTNCIFWVNSCFQFVEIANLVRTIKVCRSPTFFPIVVLNFSYTFDNFVVCLDSLVYCADITSSSKMMAQIEVTSSFDSCR